jgi:hypothetical protein
VDVRAGNQPAIPQASGTEVIMAKAAKVISTEILHNGSIKFIGIKAGDAGQNVERVLNPAAASILLRQQAQQYGWIVRGTRMAAIERNPETGLPATPQYKWGKVAAWIEHVESGTDDWNMPKGARQTGPDVGLVIRAMIDLGKATSVEHANKKIDQLAEKLGKTRDEIIVSLSKDKTISVKMAELKAADRAKALGDDAIDVSAMLDEMEEEE